MLTTTIVNVCDEREWCTDYVRNSELSTCLFQFSHKTRQTMLLYAYFAPKVDFKRKFNHHQSFLYEWRLTAHWAQTIRKFRIGPSKINTNRISNRTYDSKSNRITKLRRSLNIMHARRLCRYRHCVQASNNIPVPVVFSTKASKQPDVNKNLGTIDFTCQILWKSIQL